MEKYIMALDAGTTSSRCIIFDRRGSIISLAQREFEQIFPADGWVEHDPMTIWSTQISVATEALLKAALGWEDILGIGITNQRETVIVWDRKTGRPIYNAIVWQCGRTAAFCEELVKRGLSERIREKTGLLPDPYFSASKIKWILDNVPHARERAERGELAFGTVDCWLIWNLTAGRLHATDYSNASRTMLFNIKSLSWDNELLEIFEIPPSMLPRVMPSSGVFGYTDTSFFGHELPIAGVAGDQQAALFGQCCFCPGDVKNTYGTGAFLLMNTDDKPCFNDKGLITTIAWGIGDNVTYALEGSVFTAGASIQWLRDGLGIIDTSAESEKIASTVEDSGGVVVVPAFTGLGAPFWDPHARGLIIGLTRATERGHIVRATLESLAYQTNDVITLLEECTGAKITSLKVDGGAAANSLLLKMQADISGITIERPASTESTALGVAYLAGLALGMYSSFEDIRENKKTDLTVTPTLCAKERVEKIEIWHRAVKRSLGWQE